MKTIKTLLMAALVALLPLATQASPFEPTAERDTVVIELENGSRIIIYTKDRAELKKIQAYDINEMIRDLNKSLGENEVAYMEIKSEDGKRYLIESPEVIVGEGEAEGDTVMITEDAMDKIRIRVGGLELTMDPETFEEGYEGDGEEIKKYTYVKQETQRTRHYFNVDIGTTNWVEGGRLPTENNAPYSLKPWGSWYIGFNWLNRTKVAGPVFIEWGGGVNWYNWKLEDAAYQFVKGDTNLEMQDVLPADATALKSKLSASYINASFVPMFDFGKGSKRVTTYRSDGISYKSYSKTGFRIGAGVYAGYRLGSRSKQVFQADGSTQRERTIEADHFYLENFRYGLRGQLGFRSFDMFVLYDLNDTFVENKGPNGANLNTFTIGITL